MPNPDSASASPHVWGRFPQLSDLLGLLLLLLLLPTVGREEGKEGGWEGTNE